MRPPARGCAGAAGAAGGKPEAGLAARGWAGLAAPTGAPAAAAAAVSAELGGGGTGAGRAGLCGAPAPRVLPAAAGGVGTGPPWCGPSPAFAGVSTSPAASAGTADTLCGGLVSLRAGTHVGSDWVGHAGSQKPATSAAPVHNTQSAEVRRIATFHCSNTCVSWTIRAMEEGNAARQRTALLRRSLRQDLAVLGWRAQLMLLRRRTLHQPKFCCSRQ